MKNNIIEKNLTDKMPPKHIISDAKGIMLATAVAKRMNAKRVLLPICACFIACVLVLCLMPLYLPYNDNASDSTIMANNIQFVDIESIDDFFNKTGANVHQISEASRLSIISLIYAPDILGLRQDGTINGTRYVAFTVLPNFEHFEIEGISLNKSPNIEFSHKNVIFHYEINGDQFNVQFRLNDLLYTLQVFTNDESVLIEILEKII